MTSKKKVNGKPKAWANERRPEAQEGGETVCILSQVVYKLESETRRKMRSKGLREGKADGTRGRSIC